MPCKYSIILEILQTNEPLHFFVLLFWLILPSLYFTVTEIEIGQRFVPRLDFYVRQSTVTHRDKMHFLEKRLLDQTLKKTSHHGDSLLTWITNIQFSFLH